MAPFEHNLPAEHTPPIGRDDEAAAVRVFLLNPHTPLVTLVGPGGMGKTTLALHLAHDTLNAFPDGVHFIDLTPLTQPDLIPDRIARALGIEEAPGRTAEDALIAHYQDRRALLLLDNFEHLLPGAKTIGALLRACPTVHVLTTSREALRLQEEQVFPLPPLGLPDPGRATDLNQLALSPAVDLFVRRAQAVRPGFVLTAENAAAVAAIVARLDGLPLAIELAAARVRLFPPRVLLERLEASLLTMLAGGVRDAPERQQTVRATVAWSYNLLTPADQQFFRRLGVFANGFTLEAVEAVTGAAFAGGFDPLESLESLLDKSLIIRLPHEDELRFGMLETLRAFALDELQAAGEEEAARGAHYDFYLALAEEAMTHYRRPDRQAWVARLSEDEDNVRAALAWALGVAAENPARGAAAVQLAGALGEFWHIRSRALEAQRWLTPALAYCATPPAAGAAIVPEDRMRVAREARLHSAVGSQLHLIGDFDTAAGQHRNALACYRALDDRPQVAQSLNDLAVQYIRLDDDETAVAMLNEALAISQTAEDWWGAARVLNNLGVVAENRGNDESAEHYYREAMTTMRRTGDNFMLALLLSNLGLIALRGNRLVEAEQSLHESLALNTGPVENNQSLTAYCLLALGEIARRRGDLVAGRALYGDVLRFALENEYRYYFAAGLHALAVLELDAGNPKQAALLAGAVAALRERFDIRQLDAYSPRGLAGDLDAIRAALDEPAYRAAWEAGRRLKRREVMAVALEGASDERQPSGVMGRAADLLAELTPREREVAVLMGRGRTNEEIAAELFITLKTVEKHAGNALGKLGLRNRAELAAWLAAQGLV